MMMKSEAAGVFLWAACAAGLPGAELGMPDAAQAGHGGRLVVMEMRREAAAGDLRGLMAALPGLEPLWQEDPAAYLEALKTGVHALIASGDAEAVKAAMEAFPKLIGKRAPAGGGAEAVLACMKLKNSILDDYYQVPENRGNKEFLLLMASFLGEVRDLRIPKYQIRYYGTPGRDILAAAGVSEVKDLPTQAQKDAVAAAFKKAEEDNWMNDLQNALRSIDWSTLNTIEGGLGKAIAVPEAEKPAFYQELIKRGRLTDEEVEKLGLTQGG